MDMIYYYVKNLKILAAMVALFMDGIFFDGLAILLLYQIQPSFKYIERFYLSKIEKETDNSSKVRYVK